MVVYLEKKRKKKRTGCFDPPLTLFHTRGTRLKRISRKHLATVPAMRIVSAKHGMTAGAYFVSGEWTARDGNNLL